MKDRDRSITLRCCEMVPLEIVMHSSVKNIVQAISLIIINGLYVLGARDSVVG
jgi:hypothetical protein